MKLFILNAKNTKEMDKIALNLSKNKFKAIEKDSEFILMKKRRFGNILIHVVFLLLALQLSAIFLIVNVVYFTYSYLWASPHVLITTETEDDDGNPLEFCEMDEILKKANAIL